MDGGGYVDGSAAGLVFLQEREDILCFDNGGDDEGDGSGEGVADLEAGEFCGLAWVLVKSQKAKRDSRMI